MEEMGARLSSDESDDSSNVGGGVMDLESFMELLSGPRSQAEDREEDAQLSLTRMAIMRQLGFLSTPLSFNTCPPQPAVHTPPPVPMNTSCDMYRTVMRDSGRAPHSHQPHSITAHTEKRQLCRDSLSASQRVALTGEMLPKHHCLADRTNSRMFCGTYSKDGSMFVSSTQDSWIKLYDTRGDNFKCFKALRGRDVGWSILDTVLSPDEQWLAYSTWSPYINVVSVHSDSHHSLDLNPVMGGSFCAFSVKFSTDGNELLASSNDEHVYVYDRTRCERVLAIHAHDDDVSALNVEGESSHMIYSGGDDGLCKVWDRRILSEVSPRHVGVLAGHKDGITFIDPKGDCRYLITNSKDQTIKLWDLRQFSTPSATDATLHCVREQAWDYRWQEVPTYALKDVRKPLPGDSSVMTYAGHLVKNTLLRCRFSPRYTTGQRYIYTACAKGRVVVYDVLTGDIVTTLKADSTQGVVRDVSWHPTLPGQLVTSSWDGHLTLWSVDQRRDYCASKRRRPRWPPQHES